MSTKASPDELIVWINTQLERRHLTGAEASRMAGLSQGAISEIVNGRTPGLKVSIALAEFFGYPADYVLRLAGHLPSRPAESSASIPRLQELARRVAGLPPERQRRVMEAFLLLLEAEEVVTEHVAEEEISRGPVKG